MTSQLTALPPFPPPQPGNPFPAPSPNPTLPRGRRQRVTCPTCHARVPGLLAGCEKPLCRTADIQDDLRFVRSEDQ